MKFCADIRLEEANVNTPVADLWLTELSSRAVNYLVRNGVGTLGDLIRLRPKLGRIGFGKMTRREIDDLLYRWSWIERERRFLNADTHQP